MNAETLASHAAAEGTHAALFPVWSMIPFAGLLLSIGAMSFFAANYPHSKVAHIWESNWNKLFIALGWAAPVLALVAIDGHWLALEHSMVEYAGFIALLFSLFVISGGIYISGDIRATPAVNTAFLAIGAVLANLIGTTGASMLLIRPLLKTNKERHRVIHIPVFFIFIVSNVGGCLLPIGDPPLFMGYLRGVPFFWTLNLFYPWLVCVGILLALFYFIDRWQYRHEDKHEIEDDDSHVEPIRFRGSWNFLLLAGVLASVIFITPAALGELGWSHGPMMFAREYAMVILAMISMAITPYSGEVRRNNNFSFHAIEEVAFLFIGIFIAMIPALKILEHHGDSLGLSEPWHYFWASGILSACLDNAPTYLTFLSVEQGMVAAHPADFFVSAELEPVHVPHLYLEAIALGAVFFGAVTYIGNGPNFMVKAIADEMKFPCPDFFTFTLKFAIPILFPVFILITLLFLV